MENTSIIPVPVLDCDDGVMPEFELIEPVGQVEQVVVVPMEIAPVCSDNKGVLPECAPLAVPFVPFQQTGSEQYQPSKGVARGTLFPGLDLPFRSMVNDNELWGTPMSELMALGFAIKELQLYLDTHPDDMEALNLLNTYITMNSEGTEKYTSMYGPLRITDMVNCDSYTWIKDPWPWEKAASMEG